MGRGRILVVDDEVQIRRALNRALTARGYTVQSVGDGEAALAQAEDFNPGLVVLDLNLPGKDGIQVCRELRAWSSVPILVLSVRADEPDKVEALDLGADDYLTKPFGIDELLARVRALLRRAGSGSPAPARRFAQGGVEIDAESHIVRRNGSDVRLTKTEWALLEQFAAHPGRLLTHRWLLEQVWGPAYGHDVDVLRVFVSQLRRKIEPDPERPTILLTDPGVGYRWVLRPSGERTSDDRPTGPMGTAGSVGMAGTVERSLR
jgi:two-component system KDP operon response regulator KdpE